MTLFDHFRLSRQNTRSNPGSASNSRAASPVRDSGSPHATPPPTHHHNHFTSFFTQHHATNSSSHTQMPYSNNSHSSSKKKEYEFFPHASPIGSGGYSDVVKASWKARGGMVVAVKVVRKEAVKDHAEYIKIIGPGFERINTNPNICAGLECVCQLLSFLYVRLTCPFSTLFSWFESSSKYYVTFPLLTGGELLERLNTRGRFTEDAARRVMRVMLNTLTYIHSHGIIHRDIKPDNFLYRSPESDVDDFVIIDFGISKILDTESDDDPKTQTEVAGTPGYAAPEVFKRTGYGKNQDVFGVGVIAYNILSASSPWKAQEYMALIQETIRAEVEFRPGPFRGVSEHAKSFIKTLMSPDPYQRPSAREALSHAWLALPSPTLHGRDHIPALPDERNDPERNPLQRPPTLKPDNPIARQITASGIDDVQVLV